MSSNNNVLTLTDETFSDRVLGADQPVLVDFWAEWCQPCLLIAPTVDRIADSFAGRAIVGKVNIDENQQTAASMGIRSIPALLVYRNGEVVASFNGITAEADLTRALENAGALTEATPPNGRGQPDP